MAEKITRPNERGEMRNVRGYEGVNLTVIHEKSQAEQKPPETTERKDQ